MFLIVRVGVNSLRVTLWVRIGAINRPFFAALFPLGVLNPSKEGRVTIFGQLALGAFREDGAALNELGALLFEGEDVLDTIRGITPIRDGELSTAFNAVFTLLIISLFGIAWLYIGFTPVWGTFTACLVVGVLSVPVYVLGTAFLLVLKATGDVVRSIDVLPSLLAALILILLLVTA